MRRTKGLDGWLQSRLEVMLAWIRMVALGMESNRLILDLLEM